MICRVKNTGLACFKFDVSNMNLYPSLQLITSPFAKLKKLSLSNKLFTYSIQVLSI